MAWIALTEDDLKTYLSGSELLKLRETGSQSGDLDPIASILESVTNHVRGFIKRVQLGAEGTLPPSLKDCACRIAVVRVIAFCGARFDLADPSKFRRDSAADAEAFLKDEVLNGNVPLEPPDTLAAVQPRSMLGPTIGAKIDINGLELPLEGSQTGRWNEEGV